MNSTVLVCVFFLASVQHHHIYDSSSSMVVSAFQGAAFLNKNHPAKYGTSMIRKPPVYHPSCVLHDATTVTSLSSSSSSMATELEQFLQQEHSMFYTLLLDKNEYVWKMIRDNSGQNGACTIFAPTNAALQALGDKKIQQLLDNRNEEVRNKMGSYHIVLDDDSVVTTEQLYNSGGIRTIATGDNPVVPVERAKPSGGNIFAMFTTTKSGNSNGNDDTDGAVIMGSNNARIVNSVYFKSSNTLIHQIDALISPNILWRYCDQLRIPGSK